jgi:hypothetical protein
MLQTLLVEPNLVGNLVREIHILSEPSDATRNGENLFVGGESLCRCYWPRKVIMDGKLPYIHSQGLQFEQSWFID